VSTITGEIEIDVDAAHCHLRMCSIYRECAAESIPEHSSTRCPTAVFDAGTW